jgi:hypothetical protein
MRLSGPGALAGASATTKQMQSVSPATVGTPSISGPAKMMSPRSRIRAVGRSPGQHHGQVILARDRRRPGRAKRAGSSYRARSL